MLPYEYMFVFLVNSCYFLRRNIHLFPMIREDVFPLRKKDVVQALLGLI
jgi:hypothetical protein